MANPIDTYNPLDFCFDTKTAMRFTRKFNKKLFDDFLRSYGVRYTKRAKANIFFREELEDALRKERRYLEFSK